MEQCVNISKPEVIINGNKRRAATNASLNIAKRQASNLKRVSGLLRKKRAYKPLTEDQEKFLLANAELVKQFYKRREKRVEWQMRQNECEDSLEILEEKCFKLAQAVHDSEFLVVYTGAGISTAASIPDYRGPNGIWTRLQKGKDIGNHDLTTAEPTQTHMALAHLHSKGIVHHVVSQNCDGLHVRSGLPKTSLSEVHGNMYIEVCKHCAPAREYVRTFDVTEKTSTFKHTTGRRCYRCGEPLVDTIVHFGERGRLRWPLNWQGACQAAKACDTILCLGSSLKVLRKYTWLWQTHRPPKRRPKLFIVNLQWTPKDKDATLKINGKCDDVMKLVMTKLGLEVPEYKKPEDPIFQISTPLHIDEMFTLTRLPIEPPLAPPLPNGFDPPLAPPLPNGFDPLDKRLERLNSIVHNYKNVFSNLPSNVSANDLLATLSKLEDIKDESDAEDAKPNIKEEIKKEDEKMGIVKSEACDEIKLEDKVWRENITGDPDQEIKQEDLIKSEVPDEGVEAPDFQKGESDLDFQTRTSDVQLASDLQIIDAAQSTQANDVHMIDLRIVDDEDDDIHIHHPENQTDVKANNDDDDTKATDTLPQYLLKAHVNKNGSLKELNFYGTGLCIRSTRQPSEHHSIDDVHHSIDDVHHSIDDVRHSIDDVRHSIDDVHHSIDDVHHSIDDVRHSIDDVHHSIDDVHHSIDDVHHSIDDVHHSIDDVHHSIDDVHHSIDDVRHSIDDVHHSIDDVHHSIDDVHHSIDNVRYSIDGVHHSIDDVHHSIDGVRHSIDDVHHSIDDIHHSIDDVHHSIDDVHHSIDDVRHSIDDVHHSNDDVTDDTDTSLSSAISDLNRDHPLGSKNFECNSDVLFISDDSSESESRIGHSEENRKFVFASPLNSLQDFSFPIMENSDVTSKRNESDSDQEFTTEISVGECGPEMILSPEYSSDGHESDFGAEDGSYLIHTTVVDGVIHSAEVRTINVEYSDDKPINGSVTSVGGTAPLCTDSDSELKALWYKKFCGLSADSRAKEKNVISLELDDDVKSLWFWGFDTQPKMEKALSLPYSIPSSTTHPPTSHRQQPRRLTRSSYQKAIINPSDEAVSLVCNCLVSNPQLCRLSIMKPESLLELEEEMVKARESVRKRRQHNYKKFEPVFEISLKSLTYERRKIRRSRKEENNEDEEECDDGEELSEIDDVRKNGDTKLVPGWYGKGYRKIVKKKRNSVT